MADGSIHFDTKIDESGLKNGLSKLTGSVSSSFNKIGSAVKVGLATATASIGAASAAVGALTKDIVAGYAEYEQLVGGIETLFGAGGQSIEEYAKSVGKSVKDVEGEYDTLIQAQEMVFESADRAWKTAGLSANDYMSTATSFAASLLQSLSGDTQKAAEVTEMAITDMSDNANKMGTDMKAIQYAYQGFAKQNYTMLDNLKLGYGGTKTEMERLLADAQKLTGVKYDITNLNDVFQAIHVIQGELGITGTTAKEAATTISGSANAMKAAWSNMMVGMADDSQNFDALLDNLIESIETFAGNIIPRVQTALQGVAKLVDGVAPIIIARLPGLASTLLPQLFQTAGSIVSALAAALPGLMQAVLKSLMSVGPQLAQIGGQLIMALAQAIISTLPQLTSVAVQAITSLAQGIASGAPMVGSSGKAIISALLTAIGNSLSKLYDAGVNLIAKLAHGISSGMPSFVEKAGVLLQSFAAGIGSKLPSLIQSGVSIVGSIVTGIANSVPSILKSATIIIQNLADGIARSLPVLLRTGIEAVTSFVKGILDNADPLIDSGIKLLESVRDGVLGAVPKLIDALPVIIESAVRFLMANAPKIVVCGAEMVTQLWMGIWKNVPNLVSKLPQVAKALIEGLWNGIKNLGGWLKEKVSGFFGDVIGWVKEIFGIHSPSTVFAGIGGNIVDGTYKGIEAKRSSFMAKVKNFFSGIVDNVKGTLGIHSPSKVFKDIIGKNIGLGAIQGITATKPQLEKAMDDLFTPKGASGYISKLRSGVAGTASHTAETARTAALASPRYPSADEIAAAIWDNAPPMDVNLDGEKVGEVIEPRVSERQAQKTEMMNRRDGRVAV